MGWVRNHTFALSLGLLVVSGALLVFVVGYIGVVLFSAFEAGASMIGTLSDLVIPYVPVVAVLLIIMAISALVFSWKTLAFGWRILRRAAIPKSDRLKVAAERVEQKHPLLDDLGLAELVTPSESLDEDALEDLKRQYVDGHLTEREFEQKLDHLVVADSVNDKRATRRYEAVSNEGTAVLSKAWNEPHNQPERR